jgi:hypothetical protein
MTSTWVVVVVSIVSLTALVVYFRWRSRALLIGDRDDLSLETMRDMATTSVPLPLFEEVFRTIAQEIGARPGQLRPSDRLVDLFKVDSWQLGGAQDALEDLIRRKTANGPPSVDTIQDLLTWLARESQP